MTPSPRAVWNSGDLLAFYGDNWTSRAIEWGTWGPSHVGLLIEYKGRPLVIESTTLCKIPCALLDKVIDGVQCHDPAERVQRYDGRVYRLPMLAPLRRRQATDLASYAIENFLGESYNLPGALMSGTSFVKFLRCVPYPDLASVFCSALCAHLLMFANRLNWSDPNYYNPANLVRALRRQATHGKPERR